MSVPSNTPPTPGPDVKFGLWAAPESPLTIEYSLVVIEEIRHEVAEGFQRLSRGGIEVGGVLYGTQDGKTVRVLAMRPIACEHARGPGLIFSDKDRMGLHDQLLRDREDPHLQGLESVGWFLSHTRSDIFLNESDQEIFSIFFPSPWQVAMVVHPGRNVAMRAGFFIRDAQGGVRADRSYLEFSFPDRLAPFLDRMAGARERGERRGTSLRRQEFGELPGHERTERRERLDSMVAAAGQEPSHEDVHDAVPAFAAVQPAQPSRRKWIWVVGWAVLLVAAALFGLRYWMANSTPEPISLSVLEHGGQLQIEWNRTARPVTNAVEGTLKIVDGGKSQTIKLGRTELATGAFTYQRKTGDIEVRMTVVDSGGGKTQEASRYLGRAPEAPQSSQEIEQLRGRGVIVSLHNRDR